jgi:hypothetical protein
MSPLEGGGVQAIRPAWSFETRGVVWRIVPAERGLLLLEERDLERKTARFIALDAATGATRWNHESFGDPWWIGILGLGDGILLLHGFAAPDMPLPRGLIGVRMESGEILWRRDDLEQPEFRSGGVTAVRRDGVREQQVRIHVRTGEEESGARVVDPASARDDDAIRFPLPLREDEARLQTLEKYWRGAELAVPVEAIQLEALTVFAVHALSGDASGAGPGITSTVRIADAAGNVVFEQVVARDVRGGIPDSFLLVGDMLLLLVDRRRLVAVRVAPPAL